MKMEGEGKGEKCGSTFLLTVVQLQGICNVDTCFPCYSGHSGFGGGSF